MVFEGKENHEVYEALNSSCKYTWKYTRFHFCFINRNASFNLFKPKVVLKTTKILKKRTKLNLFVLNYSLTNHHQTTFIIVMTLLFNLKRKLVSKQHWKLVLCVCQKLQSHPKISHAITNLVMMIITDLHLEQSNWDKSSTKSQCGSLSAL